MPHSAKSPIFAVKKVSQNLSLRFFQYKKCLSSETISIAKTPNTIFLRHLHIHKRIVIENQGSDKTPEARILKFCSRVSLKY